MARPDQTGVDAVENAAVTVQLRHPRTEYVQIPRRAPPISLRAYDARHDLVLADLAEGQRLGARIDAMLSRDEVACVHLHHAKPGCYAARADRAPTERVARAAETQSTGGPADGRSKATVRPDATC